MTELEQELERINAEIQKIDPLSKIEISHPKNPNGVTRIMLSDKRIRLSVKLLPEEEESLSEDVAELLTYGLDTLGLLLTKDPETETKVNFILKKSATAFNTTVEKLKSRTRERNIVYARHISRKIIYEQMKGVLSFEAIGERTGGYDHSTVIHSVRTANNLIETNKEFRLKYEKISILAGYRPDTF